MEMNQKDYWDKASLEKEFTTPFQIEAFKRHVEQNAKILDIGCGYGRVLDSLWKEGYQKSLGLDFSSGMIERGKALYPQLKMKETAMPFDLDDNSFDAVVLVAVLTCIVEDSTQKALIKEIRRVLRPGGVLYINDFLINQDERNIKRYKDYETKYGSYGVFELDEGAQLRHHTEDHLFEIVSDFESIEYEQLVYTTMNKHKSNGFYYLGKL